MPSDRLRVAGLLFCSGMCALVYQMVWTRELRLIFGASTPASAAVLAIFMGGLGVGGIVIGRRAQRHERPLSLYAWLEFLIAGTAALTPIWVVLVRKLYVVLGGTVALGLAGGTVMRLVLSLLVLCVPTVLMGGTLPAAAKAVQDDQDSGRRHVAILYGVNTLGAVLGTLLATFVLLERYGNRTTLWMACAVNLVVAYFARKLAHDGPEAARVPAEAAPSPPPTDAAGSPLPPVWFVLTAAALAGLAFLLMELVWYRMLGPILGGSTFTFGLILAVALLGIGLGGTGYALWGQQRPPTLHGFAVLCLLEGLLVIAPYALGDRIALLALMLRPLAALGFASCVFGWFLVTCAVILPAAFIAGWQFPVLIALLGHGKQNVGRHVGLAYAWNTTGAIVGSLAGGFGLLPLLSAPGVWRLSAGLLCGLGVAAGVLSFYLDARRAAGAAPAGRRLLAFALGIAIATGVLLQTEGPTAVWRHSGIGAGRAQVQSLADNPLHSYVNERRRAIVWEKDGVESSVALSIDDTGMAFVVNGKTDGNAHGDAGTQVLSGMLAALLHPQPRRALVIGLGTGSTAGWLGVVPGIERVDVAEIEPNILHVARECAPVNQNVLDNPKVQLFIGDGRELLLTTRERYDIMVSEPSNPYRAGIASLYTQDFYRSVVSRLTPEGLFVQWVQTYDVDDQTVHTIYATLASSFPVVETWTTQAGDLLLIGALQPIRYDVAALRARIPTEPFKSALAKVWRVTNLEGVLAHYVARDSLTRALARSHRGALNTDDLTPAEFGFGRSLGRQDFALFHFEELLAAVHHRKEDIPELTGGSIDMELLDAQRVARHAANEETQPNLPFYTQAQRQRAAALQAFGDGNLPGAMYLWKQQPREPSDLAELSLVAEGLADLKDEAARPYIEKLGVYFPGEADALNARLLWRQGHNVEAATALEAALRSYHSDLFVASRVMQRALRLAVDMSRESPPLASRFLALLQQPFSLGMLDESRFWTEISLAELGGFSAHCAQVVSHVEPYVPWQQAFLLWRLNCYRLLKRPELAGALADMTLFVAQEPSSLATGLR